MKQTLQVKKYSKLYKQECQNLFDSNLDVFFDVSERADFFEFLDEPTCDYFVFYLNNEIVACGGYYISSSKIGALCWGMVRRDMHKKNIGFEMTSLRLAEVFNRGASKVIIDTTKHSSGFYEKLGFEVVDVVKDGYAVGLDRVNLEKNA